MPEPLTFLEHQLIRASLTSKTDSEISELIERSTDEVIEFIKQLMGPDATNRSMLIEQHRRDSEENKKRPFKNSKKKKETSFEQQDLPAASRKRSYNADIETVRKEKRRNDDRKKYATRQIDWSQMKRVKIDSRTTIMVARSTPDTVAIAQYHANRKIYSKNLTEEFQ